MAMNFLLFISNTTNRVFDVAEPTNKNVVTLVKVVTRENVVTLVNAVSSRPCFFNVSHMRLGSKWSKCSNVSKSSKFPTLFF